MKKLFVCCTLLGLMALAAFASDNRNAQTEVGRLEAELINAADPVAIKHLKIELEERYALHPPLIRAGSLDDAPANDLCENAIGVAIGSTTAGTTTEATFDDVGFCGTANTAAGVWYSVIGDGNAMEASTCNDAAYDTKLTILEDGCGTLSCVAGNDDAGGCVSFSSKVGWASTNGVEYLILVHGFGSATGDFNLTITSDSPPEVPENDDCADAIALAVPSTTDGSTSLATADEVDVCGGFSSRIGVWYTVVGTGNEMTASTCDNLTNYDTQIAVLEGSCDGDLLCIAANDDNCGLQSSVSWCSDEGVVYYIFVHGFGGNTGDFVLHLEDSGYDCHCNAPEVQFLNVDVLPLCQCINICADQPLTLCIGPLTHDEMPIAFTITPGCEADPQDPRVPGEGCDSPECPPAVPVPISDWTYSPDAGRWCITLISSHDGCFCFCLDEILPIELSSFAAIAGDGEITLNWTTASETDNDHFEIMRDGTIVGSIGANNSPTGGAYSWTESDLVNGREYAYTLIAVSLSGVREEMAVASATPGMTSAAVSEYALHQNFPNPFNPETRIAFDIVEAGPVSLRVFNALGQEVASLVSGRMEAGHHMVSFEASNLPSGIYFYRLAAGDFTANKKMILMK